MLRSLATRAAPSLRRGFAAEAASAKLKFNLLLPNAALYENKEVDLVRYSPHHKKGLMRVVGGVCGPIEDAVRPRPPGRRPVSSLARDGPGRGPPPPTRRCVRDAAPCCCSTLRAPG